MTLSKLVPICFVALASPCAVKQPPAFDVPPSQYPTITGRVLYASGKPVDAATVEISFFGPIEAFLPALALPVHTDSAGRYKITYPWLGEGFIGASKPSEGYPNTMMALYDPKPHQGTLGESPSGNFIHLKAGAHLENVDFVLKHPNPIVTFQVQDSTTGRPLDNAGIDIGWFGDRDLMMSSIVPKDGMYELVLPNHPLEVKVHAPGCIDWHWQANPAQAKSVGKPFAMRTTVVVPLAKAGP